MISKCAHNILIIMNKNKVIHIYSLIIASLFIYSSYAFSAAKPFSQTGIASYYADKYQGRKTANGERFDQNKLTAAHKKLKFNTKVRVTNIKTGKSIIVRINDRGPFVKGRIIDLSKAGFKKLGNTKSGVMKVKIEVVK